MNEKHLSPQFEENVRKSFEVPEIRSEFVHQKYGELMHHAAVMPRQSHSFLRWHPAWAVALAILSALIIGVLAVGPERVIAAIGHILGYIPGIGFVEAVPDLQVLETPVIQERGGIRLTVEQAVADPKQTVIFYTVEGLSLEAASSQGETAQTGSFAHLLLPDGSSLSQTGGDGNGWETGYQARLVFPPLQAEIEEVTLVLPRLQGMSAGASPEDWQLSLRLKPDLERLVILPVFELQPATPIVGLPVEASITSDDENAPESTPTLEITKSPYEDMRFIAENAVLLSDHYLFTGRVEWNREDYKIKGIESDQVSLFDADGNKLYIKPTSPETQRTDPQAKWFPWAYQTGGTAFRSPLTLTIQSLWLEATPQELFSFDPGPNLQIGQTWALNQSLDVAGYSLQITSARYVTGKHGPEIIFEIQVDPEVIHVELVDEEHFFGSSASGAVKGVITAAVFYPDGIPEGPLSLTVNKIGYRLPGPWEIPMQLP